MRYIILTIIMVTFTACSYTLEKEKLEKEIKPLASILHEQLGSNYVPRKEAKTIDDFKKYLPMKLTPCNDEIAECKRLDRSVLTKLYYYKKGKDTFAITIGLGDVSPINDIPYVYYSLKVLHHDTYVSCMLQKECKKPLTGLGRGCNAWFKQ